MPSPASAFPLLGPKHLHFLSRLPHCFAVSCWAHSSAWPRSEPRPFLTDRPDLSHFTIG